jgi:hypothetical protein
MGVNEYPCSGAVVNFESLTVKKGNFTNPLQLLLS